MNKIGSLQWTIVAVVAATFIAIVLGAAATPFVLLGLGGIIAASPRSFGNLAGRSEWIFAGLAVLAAGFAFLPAAWFPMPAWRESAGEIGLQTGNLLSPQFGASARAFAMLVAGILWFLWLSRRDFCHSERRWICQALALFGAVLGLLYLALKASGTTWPGANYDDQFGPFANRNQTGTVLMLCGVLAIGLARGQRVRKQVLWLTCLLIIAVGLVAVGSRSAIALLIISALVLSLRTASFATIGVVFSILLLAGTGLIVSKSEIVTRFWGQGGLVETAKENGRWALYADSAELLSESPVSGVGLGNFEGVFAMHRNRSSGPDHALHPDSDFFWFATEVGWGGALALVGLLVTILLRKKVVAPEAKRSRRGERFLQFSCLVGGLAFALNALVDVPVHRFGTFLCGALVFALGVRPQRLAQSVASPRTLQFACAASIAIASICLMVTRSGGGSLDVEKHFAGAQASLAEGDVENAAEQFARARFLRPEEANVSLIEGEIWLPHSLHRSVAAWRSGLDISQRHGSDEEFFHSIFKHSSQYPDLQRELWMLADRKPDLQLISISRAQPDQGRKWLRDVLQTKGKAEDWNHDQIAKLLEHFVRLEGSDRLVALVERRPDWQPLCWRPLAKEFLSRGESQRAFNLIVRNCPTPDLRHVGSQLSSEALRSEHLRSPKNLTPAIRFAHRLMQQRKFREAITVLENSTAGDSNKPPVFHFLVAHCLAAEKQHEDASAELLSYVDQVGP